MSILQWKACKIHQGYFNSFWSILKKSYYRTLQFVGSLLGSVLFIFAFLSSALRMISELKQQALFEPPRRLPLLIYYSNVEEGIGSGDNAKQRWIQREVRPGSAKIKNIKLI